ncbi:MAG: carbon storage regulator [Rhodopirellula sp.]|jgi:carbon storage regulator|nr:carbon storage regulator [Rhodopirellula sp.]
MLVLSRREGETLVIGGNVVITVKQVRGSRVQVGIEAPDDVRVRRGELEPWRDESNADDHEKQVAFESES